MTRPEPVAASVIIPVYNGANYITQQLDALAAQTGTPVLRCSFAITAVPTARALWSKATMPPIPCG